jgi:lipopolysaccharide/colanic/teichoic acid biosynthesis glycosyltransferase
VGILLTFPLWIVIAMAIKLTSRGPVFYSQTRVGLDKRGTGIRGNDPRRRQDIGGRPFRIFKFRTMTVDAERGTGAVWAAQDDCRVTSVGRVLRQYRLDELPQLINVLRGEMNVVGPRPERPAILTDLRLKIPDYQGRQRVRPGITGHAQINLEYDSTLEDVKKKVHYDLEYIRRQGFWADLKIMAETLPVMLFRRGSR